MASIMFSDCPATSFSPPPSKNRPVTSARGAHWNRCSSRATTRSKNPDLTQRQNAKRARVRNHPPEKLSKARRLREWDGIIPLAKIPLVDTRALAAISAREMGRQPAATTAGGFPEFPIPAYQALAKSNNRWEATQGCQYNTLKWLAVPKGFEPLTFGLGNRCSILLSYGTRWNQHLPQLAHLESFR
jgi:hypothetical protein